MNKLENHILSKVEDHLLLLTTIAVMVISAFIRFLLRDFTSGDASVFLLPWYDTIAQNGLYNQVGDYNLLYQFLIWIMTKLPLKPLYAYKILSCLFDYLLAFCLGRIAYSISDDQKKWTSILVFSYFLLCPVFFLNSAAWAQCDSMFCFFAILCLLFLVNGQYNSAFIALGFSFALKLHAVFILPLFLFVYFVKKEFSILRFLIIPFVMLICAAPILFWGRNPLDTFGIYMNQTHTYPAMSMNFPSAWLLLCLESDSSQYILLKPIAMLFTVCVLAMLMVDWIRKKYSATGTNLIIMAFLSVFTCILFLPAMHERYSYLHEALGILLAVLFPQTIPLCVGLLLISLNTYGHYLFGLPINITALSWLNIGIFMAYTYIFSKELSGFKGGINK